MLARARLANGDLGDTWETWRAAVAQSASLAGADRAQHGDLRNIANSDNDVALAIERMENADQRHSATHQLYQILTVTIPPDSFLDETAMANVRIWTHRNP